MRVALCGGDHEVVLPARYAEKRELAQLAYANALRGAGAVLATCCPSLGLRANLRAYRGDVAEFGATAWEELHHRGVGDADMVTAAQPVLEAICEAAFPSAEAVAERANFSGQPPAAPTTPR